MRDEDIIRPRDMRIDSGGPGNSNRIVARDLLVQLAGTKFADEGIDQDDLSAVIDLPACIAKIGDFDRAPRVDVAGCGRQRLSEGKEAQKHCREERIWRPGSSMSSSAATSQGSVPVDTRHLRFSAGRAGKIHNPMRCPRVPFGERYVASFATPAKSGG